MPVTKTLPVIDCWPYSEVARSVSEFHAIFGKSPASIWIGVDLWMMLREVSNSDDFLVAGEIPVFLDQSGILEGHEFIVSGVTHD